MNALNGPWRDPAVTTSDYPGLEVDDDRCSGSIVAAGTRHDLAQIIPAALAADWPLAAAVYRATGLTREQAVQFVQHLLSVPGEFARLLCALANAARIDEERTNAELERYASLEDPEAIPLPVDWWQDRDLTAPVMTALLQCLRILVPPGQVLAVFSEQARRELEDTLDDASKAADN